MLTLCKYFICFYFSLGHNVRLNYFQVNQTLIPVGHCPMTDAYLQPWNSLNNLKYELMKILHGFQVLKYALWQKTKYRNCRKSAESFLNKKVPLANNYHCYKTAKKFIMFYLSTILVLITRKATFKLQW